MILYTDADSPECLQVRIVIAEKQLPVEIYAVDPLDKPEDLRYLNPYDTLPTLVDRELVLYNARIISEYLDERYPHNNLFPREPAERARTRIALYRIQNDWYSLVAGKRSGAALAEGRSASNRDQAIVQLRDALRVASDLFSAHPYFLSETYSFTDVMLSSMFWGLQDDRDAVLSTNSIREYANRLFSRESFVEAVSLPGVGSGGRRPESRPFGDTQIAAGDAA